MKGKESNISLGVTVFLTLVILTMIIYGVCRETGRTRLENCTENRVLYSPGNWTKDYCIRQERQCSANDAWTYTCRDNIKCFLDRNKAYRMCRTGF